jgi:hypothetical protein
VTPDELRALTESAGAPRVRAELAAMPERDRRSLARAAFAEWRRVDQWGSIHSEEHRAAARMAAFCTCGPSELGELAKHHALDESLAELWREIRPSWLDQGAELLLEGHPRCWRLARRLVRDGLSATPRSENYVLGLYAPGFAGWGKHQRSLVDILLEDSEFLERDIWRMFEVEGGGELSLAAHDKYAKRDTWSQALRTLMERGQLPRERLLDASLAALERDFSAFRAGWFSRFHEELAPTPDERRARLASYLRLLGSAVAPTASLALEAIRTIDRYEPLTAGQLLPFVPPLLTAKSKGTAKAAFGLLATIAERGPEARALIARAAVAGLAHEAADVQSAALDVIEKYGAADDAGLARGIAEKALLVAPSVAKRLHARGVAPSVEAAGANREPLPVAGQASPLDPARALTPLATVDDVIDRLAHVIEDASDPNEVELVLEGVARLGGAQPPDFERRIGPLRKRARALRPRHRGERFVAYAMTGVALAWCGEEVERPDATFDVRAFELLLARADRVAAAARARTPLGLLSTPTHRGGWIAPAALVERALRRERRAVLDPIDASMALLRLAPAGRQEALAGAARITGELGEAIRYALGGPASIGETASLWVAAARARASRGDDLALEARHPALGPDAAEAARWTWQVQTRTSGKYTFRKLAMTVAPAAPATVRLDLPSVLAHAFGGEKTLLRWASTVWPAGSESVLARGVERIANNLDWWEAQWPNAAYLEILCDPCTVYGPNATLLLALGLAAKEPGESGLSVDAAIAALGDGRLTGAALGGPMAELMPTGLVKAARWGKTLGVVAGASDAHAREVTAAIQRALRGDPELAPRDQGALVALLRELLLARNDRVTDGEAWAYLAASRHKSKVRDVAPGA